MAKWLYSSRGQPIAFMHNSDQVFSETREFIGFLDGNEVWHGSYKGELVKGDMLLTKQGNGAVSKGRSGTPCCPGIPSRPGSRGICGIVSGYDDLTD